MPARCRFRFLKHSLVVLGAFLFLVSGPMPRATAQYLQQGSKLVGTGASGTNPEQGYAVALSADGNTLAVGAPGDDPCSSPCGGQLGAAWVFTRTNGTWSQQGQKLVGFGASGESQEGFSVALSGDGTTLALGGPYDNSDIGAVWVFTGSNGVWTQQAELVGSGAIGQSVQGWSVALSSDGNTLLVGGRADNSSIGAAWVFTRSGGVWTQQAKLLGSDAVGQALQGQSVALSSDGNTAMVGGFQDNSGNGAAWVFTRSNGAWSQQGPKLSGTGGYDQGLAVALSSDGNTAAVGGFTLTSDTEGVWFYSRSGDTWTQQGPLFTMSATPPVDNVSLALSADGNMAFVGGYFNKSNVAPEALSFVRTGSVWTQVWSQLDRPLCLNGDGSLVEGGPIGPAVALSANAETAVIGMYGDNTNFGATCVFTLRAGHDFNDDGVSDILWRDTSGDLAMWLMSAGQESSGATLGDVDNAWSVVGQRDFNGDGDADILWFDGAGDLGLWEMNGTSVSSQIGLGNVGASWSVVGTGDFNGDGTGDILWRDGGGNLAIWLMSKGQFWNGVSLGQVSSDWSVAGIGDFNGDAISDILWRNTQTGELAIWLLNNSGQMSSGLDLGEVPLAWSVVGIADFNGDGISDILWGDTTGDYAIWLMNNGQFSSGATIASGVSSAWSVAETGDFNGDGKSDILWIDTSGDVAVWLMNGTSLSSGIGLGNVGTSWTVQGQNAD